MLPAIWRLRILGRHTGEKDGTFTYSVVYLFKQSVTAAHLFDVKPTRVAKVDQSLVQRLYLKLLVPLVRDEGLWRRFHIDIAIVSLEMQIGHLSWFDADVVYLDFYFSMYTYKLEKSVIYIYI